MNYAINSLLFTPAQLQQFTNILCARDLWLEHDLLKLTHVEFSRATPNFGDPLSLFQGHFVLFNALYRLIADDTFKPSIELQLTQIKLSDTKPQQINSALMAYYLDEENLINTTRTMLGQMLENFGAGFTQYLESQHPISDSPAANHTTPRSVAISKLTSDHKKT
jgi:hypothetical protein